jgi:ABC-type polysaccharide/polyol phosphate transport system ATPase subunit
MAGIYQPTRGHIQVEGSITPLFDIMPGLDVEDSGYENIFISGLLLGMSRDYKLKNFVSSVSICRFRCVLTLLV